MARCLGGKYSLLGFAELLDGPCLLGLDFVELLLEERPPDHQLLPYNYAMSQIGHEMGHRWAASVSAKVMGETIPLGPVHWARGLQASAAFPYQRPAEASAMGGGVWQDNLDGAFTQLADDYYVPATSYSYLDLYLMGLISATEVPDFSFSETSCLSVKTRTGTRFSKPIKPNWHRRHGRARKGP
ncbi:MAG: hypothetical protein LAP86_32535 [Acidobacteriia bacterium]|nr:hypothetical protein [Terriglobia bacterium]